MDRPPEPVLAGVGVGVLSGLVVDGLVEWGVDLTAGQQSWITRTLFVVGAIGGAVWGRRKVTPDAK